MYTPKDIAEALEKIPADDLDVTAIAWCDLHDRITRETGLSEEAVRQMMKKECLLWVERCASSERGCSPGRWCHLPSIGRTEPRKTRIPTANLRWTKP
jgi:hypothetical protein